jgi:hypothetical protein
MLTNYLHLSSSVGSGESILLQCRGLFGTALRPALSIKEITFTTLPREFLGADIHVIGKCSFVTVRMLIEKVRVKDREHTDGNTHPKGNADPAVHFFDFFGGVMCVQLGQLLLVLDTGTNLLDSFGLHLSFGSQTGKGLGRTARDLEGRSAAASKTRGDSKGLFGKLKKSQK